MAKRAPRLLKDTRKRLEKYLSELDKEIARKEKDLEKKNDVDAHIANGMIAAYKIARTRLFHYFPQFMHYDGEPSPARLHGVIEDYSREGMGI